MCNIEGLIEHETWERHAEYFCTLN